MSNYELCKKYIEFWNTPSNYFPSYANIMYTEYRVFSNFIRDKYGSMNHINCQKYIDFIDYIRNKL